MRRLHLVLSLCLLSRCSVLLSGAEPVMLTNGRGATLLFTESEGSWRWSTLASPGAPEDGWRIADNAVEISIGDRTETLAESWTLVDASTEKVVFEQESAAIGMRVRRVFSFGAAPNVVRLETWLQSADGKKLVTRIGLLDAQVEGETFREMGAAPVSFPLFGQALFFGIEHVSGECAAIGEFADRVQLQQRPRVTVDDNWRLIATVVAGWPLPGTGSGLKGEQGMREAFLQYLDTVRVKPDRIFLHTDTWWTVPLPLNEKNVLNDIETLRKAFGERTGMFFDTYCVDLGWSNPQTFWRMQTERFPNELRAIDDRLEGLGTKMGLWMSPGSGYPDGLSNSWLQAQGYEMTPFPGKLGQVPCFALGGRYQRDFKERVISYAQQYGLGHVILDFMLQRCDVASHGHPVGPESRYAIDAGLADVLDGLRAVNPGIALEPMVCGYPPSPWWLMKTPFVLGPAGDDLPFGRGPCPEWLESLITARDVAYRAGQEAWIMPTQALETFDIIVLTPGNFQNMAVMAIGRGRWFLSTYFKSDLMSPEDWDFLAALVRWARENKQYLTNAWQFGGKPENREAYGFMFRNAAKDLYCVRNPWMEERSIVVPGSATATEAREVRMIYPRRATVGRIEPGATGLPINVGPYETIFLEAVPAAEETIVASAPVIPQVAVVANTPSLPAGTASQSAKEISSLRWMWDGALSVPENSGAELCILVESSQDVNSASCLLSLGGREVKLREAGSAGQFGAAVDASPENWVWFIAPLPAGDTAFQIDLTVLADQASIGVFVRGAVPVPNDAAPENGAVFPTFNPNRRAWSQTLFPLQEYVASPP